MAPDTESVHGITSPKTAAERIGASSTIAVVLPERPDMRVAGSAAALVSGLRAAGKTVSVFAASNGGPLPARNAFAEDNEPLREFIISFDLARSPIKELKYERAGNRLDVILSPNGRIRREDVAFRWGELRYDLVITLGARSPDELASSIQKAPELIHERPVLNIDSDPRNNRYGDLNLVPAENLSSPATLAEMVSGLLDELGTPADAERATALFSSLASSTDDFQPNRTSSNAFRLAAELRDRGADLKAAVLASASPDSALRLAGRALARSKHDTDRSILWAFLTADDFLKTGADHNDIEAVLNHLIRSFRSAGRHVILWQHRDETVIRVQALMRKGEDASLLLPDAFPSFAAAEEHINQLLRVTDAVE